MKKFEFLLLLEIGNLEFLIVNLTWRTYIKPESNKQSNNFQNS